MHGASCSVRLHQIGARCLLKTALPRVKCFQVFTKDKAVLGASACVHAILGRGEECQLTDESQGFKSGVNAELSKDKSSESKFESNRDNAS